jgi:hypothetical protein
MTSYYIQHPPEQVPMVTQEQVDGVRAWLRTEDEATDLFFDNYFHKRPDAHFFEAVDAWRADLGYKPKPDKSFLHKDFEIRLFFREYRRKHPNSIVGDGDRALSQYFGNISRSYVTPDPAPELQKPLPHPELKEIDMNRKWEYSKKEGDYFMPQRINLEKAVITLRKTSSHVKDEILNDAELYHWENVFQIGSGSMVHEPQQIGDWIVYPMDQYPENIPNIGLKKKSYLSRYEDRLKGWVVLDDVRHVELMPAPEPIRKHRPIMWRFVFETTAKILLFAVAGVVGLVVGAVLLAIALAVGVALLALAALPAALAYDPILCCVTEDNEWIAVHWWRR